MKTWIEIIVSLICEVMDYTNCTNFLGAIRERCSVGSHETHLPGLYRTRVHELSETTVTPPTTFAQMESVDLSVNDAKHRRHDVHVSCVRPMEN